MSSSKFKNGLRRKSLKNRRAARFGRTLAFEPLEERLPLTVAWGNYRNQEVPENNWIEWNSWEVQGMYATARLYVQEGGGEREIAAQFNQPWGTFDLNSFDSVGGGIFVVRIWAPDPYPIAYDQATFAITWDDDPYGPSISFGNAISQNDGNNNVISWNVYDPSNVEIVHTTMERSNGVGGWNMIDQYWNHSAQTGYYAQNFSGSFNLNSQSPGRFRIGSAAFDGDADRPDDGSWTGWTYQEFDIFDDDTNGPAISFANTVDQSDSANNIVSVNFSDPSLVDEYWAELYKLDDNGNWQPVDRRYSHSADTSTITESFDMNSLSPGTYGLYARAWDMDTDWDRYSDRSVSKWQWNSDGWQWSHFVISDDDTTGPTISFDNAVSHTDGDPNNYVGWSIADSNNQSGISSRTVQLVRAADEFVIQENTNLDTDRFQSLAPGSYYIRAKATDNDTDWGGGDRKSAMPNDAWVQSAAFTVTDDDASAPTILLSGSSGTESHGLTQSFTWDVSDVSGLGSVVVTVQKDGVPFYSYPYPSPIVSPISRSYSFDNMGIGTFDITVTAADADTDWGTGDRLTGTATRSVIVTNASPIAVRDSFSLDEDTTLTVSPQSLLLNDTDADGDPLSVRVSSLPSHGTLTIQPDGSVTYLPDRDFNGTDSFVYLATDGFVDSAPAMVNLTVRPVADPPTLSVPESVRVPEGSLVTFQATATDPDSAPEMLTFFLENAPPGATIDPKTGCFTWTPADDQQAVITVAVSDGALSAQRPFLASVDNVAPQHVTITAPTSGLEGSEITVTGSAVDPGADTLSYTWTVLKDEAAYATGDGQSFTFTPDDQGSYTVQLTVSDEDGGSTTAAPATFVAANVAPTAGLSGNGPITYGDTAVVSFSDQLDPSFVDTTVGFHYAYATSPEGLTGVAYASAGTDSIHSFTGLDLEPAKAL